MKKITLLLLALAVCLNARMPFAAASAAMPYTDGFPAYSVTEPDGAGYYTNISDGAALTEAGYFYLFGGMNATLSRNGAQAQAYESGSRIGINGGYTVVLTSAKTAGYSKTIHFTVNISEKAEALIPVNPLTSENTVDTNSGTDSAPVTGGWSYESTLRPDIYTEDGGGALSPEAFVPASSVTPVIPYERDEDTVEVPWETGGDLDAYGGGDDDRYVQRAEIRSVYHAEFQLYEHSFGDKYFYSNAANGAITSQPVFFDIPAGISVSAEMDGGEIKFVNKGEMSKTGSYMLRLTAGMPEYTAVFRFRIQPADEAQGGIGAAGGIIPGLTAEQRAELERPAADGTDLGFSALTEEELMEFEDTGELSEADIVERFNEAAGLISGAADRYAKYSGLSESFDPDKGMFSETTAGDFVFYASEPNGSITNGPVTFSFPDAAAEVIVTRNNEPYEYIAGDTISESGFYSMVINGQSYDTLMAGGVAAQYNFRVVTAAVCDLDVYNAPRGFVIEKAELDGEEISVLSPTSARLESDGQYEFTIRGDGGEAAIPARGVTILRDTAPPDFELIGVENGRSTAPSVTVQYMSDDVDVAELFNGGVKAAFNGRDIEDPGIYLLTVYDNAGNSSSAEFEMVYRLNVAGILAIALIVLIISGGAVFFLRTRKTVSVR